MKCISCESWSLAILCTTCQNRLLQPSFYKRQLDNDFYVYSFYRLEEIENLLSSKYSFHGDRVFNILAKLSFQKFAQNFTYEHNLLAIPIDDHTRHEFSHTALLARYLQSQTITPSYNHLKASNHIQYAGKSLEFREKNPRRFKLHNLKNKNIILVDDIITTGLTLKEARKVCLKNKSQVLFALTLADAKL